jgi:hypothetical protein
VYYTSEVASGYRHSNENRPTLLAGQLGGTITTGRLMYAGTPVKNAADPTAPTYGADGTWSTCNENSQACAMQTPVANLYVGLLSNLGVPTDKFANSTGALTLT